MNIKNIAIISILASTLLLAHSDEQMKQAKKTGAKISNQMIKNLGGKLKKQMKKNGPIAALEFCSKNAIKFTDKMNKKLGDKISVKRVSLNPRNEKNAASKEEQEILTALKTINQNNIKLPSGLIQESEAGYRYIKPLTIEKKVCLMCHGTKLKPEIESKLKTLYPNDKATGHMMGDLRGAIIIDIAE